jgi:ABC-type phosphate transport system substrate-binding protein
LCAATGRASADDGFKVIVHPNNPITAIDHDFLRDVYLKRAAEWSNGHAVRPIDLTSRFAARERFTHDVLKKSPSQLKNYWNQQIFSGKGVPPPEADSVSEIIEFVLANPWAVGYVPASADTGRAKVVKLD